MLTFTRVLLACVATSALVAVFACSSFDASVVAATDAAADVGDTEAGVVATPDASDGGFVPTLCAPNTCRLVFVTSKGFAGNLGGVAGGDTECQVLADASAIAGIRQRQFRAWLSADAQGATLRHPHSDVPYQRVDGTVVANDWNTLTSGQLSAPIMLDENGAVVSQALVWTGTSSNGTSSLNTCLSWSVDTALGPDGGGIAGQVGRTDRIDEAWTDGDVPLGNAQGCDKVARLYCFEQ